MSGSRCLTALVSSPYRTPLPGGRYGLPVTGNLMAQWRHEAKLTGSRCRTALRAALTGGRYRRPGSPMRGSPIARWRHER